MSQITIALDAGHGGSDPGATYQGRKEKDDTLRLVKAVGKILENNGINVVYTRTTDEYETPFKKATDGNDSGADYFVSIHRNSSEKDNQFEGVETLVYDDSGIKAAMGRNINAQLAKLGFKNLGIDERPNLVVLKRTKMPALLVEVGFINSDADNATFDDNFNEIAQAIADGIIMTIKDNPKFLNKTDSESEERQWQYNTDDSFNEYNNYSNQYKKYTGNTNSSDNFTTSSIKDDVNPLFSFPDEYTAKASPQTDTVSAAPETEEKLYRVQVGAYKLRENADRMLNSLLMEGFPAFILNEDDYYKVQVGAFRYLTNAIKMERKLRRFHYSTYIVYS